MKTKKPTLIFFALVIFFLFVPNEYTTRIEANAKEDLLPQISVIYPQEGAQIGVSDSTFIFGSVTPDSKLKINGFDVKIHPNGAFLAFLPLKPGDFIFELIASNKQGTSTKRVGVKVPKPILSVPEDSFCIIKGSFLPKKDMILTAGDILEVGFRGTPKCKASFSIEGLVSDIPMIESPPKTQPYWAREVFGEELLPEEYLLKGVYTGSYIIKNTDKVDSAKIIFKLSKKRGEKTATILDSSQIKIAIRQDEIPQIVEFTGSSVIARAGPKLGYLLLYQPSGIKAQATGKIGEWVRLKLAEGENAWVHQDSLKYLPLGTPIPKSILTSMRTQAVENPREAGEDTKTQLKISLQEKLPFRIEQQLNPSSLLLTIYGVTSNTDWIRYDSNDQLIKEIQWAQPKKEVYQLKIYLNLEQQWGYDAFYEGSALILEIKDEPKLKRKLEGLKIAVDPGHSPDPGAVGPTGLEERVVNLEIAKKLKEILEQNGAVVILTRSGMDSLALYDRPKIAIQEKCDILISIHNNALPDGINPFYNNGTSTYYYHPQAFALAKEIHKELVKNLGLPDYGIYYGNLALTRPYQLLAVLVECAFMMIPEQEELLRTEKFQEKCAQAISNGILSFMEKSKM